MTKVDNTDANGPNFINYFSDMADGCGENYDNAYDEAVDAATQAHQDEVSSYTGFTSIHDPTSLRTLIEASGMLPSPMGPMFKR